MDIPLLTTFRRIGTSYDLESCGSDTLWYRPLEALLVLGGNLN